MELVNRKRLLHTIRAYCIFRRCSIRFFPLLYTVWYLSITLYGYHTYGKVRFPREKQPFPPHFCLVCGAYRVLHALDVLLNVLNAVLAVLRANLND